MPDRIDDSRNADAVKKLREAVQSGRSNEVASIVER
jgi:hypothetical protein